MINRVEATPTASCYGRRVVEQARRLGISPATIVRHVRRGRRLSDGSVARITATVMPGGYRVTDEAIDRFYAQLTADRLGGSGGPPRSPTHPAGERADDRLAREGW